MEELPSMDEAEIEFLIIDRDSDSDIKLADYEDFELMRQGSGEGHRAVISPENIGYVLFSGVILIGVNTARGIVIELLRAKLQILVEKAKQDSQSASIRITRGPNGEVLSTETFIPLDGDVEKIVGKLVQSCVNQDRKD